MTKTYTKNTWVDETLSDTEKFNIKDSSGNEIESDVLIELATSVVQSGTPVNAVRMNNIENGIDGLDTLMDIPDATAKTTPVDADLFKLVDSAASNAHKKITWANIIASITSTLNSVFKFETVVHAATSKATPVDADEIGIVDSAASNGIKKLTWANLKTTLSSVFKFETVVHAATFKVTLASNDEFGIVDSEHSNVLAKVAFSSLISAIQSALNSVYLALSGGTLTGKLTMGTNNIEGTTYSLNDGTATSFTPPNTFGSVLIVGRVPNAAYYVLAIYRVDASAAMVSISLGSSSAVTTGALTGSTGGSGKFTVSAGTDGKIYLENRTGAQRSFSVNLLGS